MSKYAVEIARPRLPKGTLLECVHEFSFKGGNGKEVVFKVGDQAWVLQDKKSVFYRIQRRSMTRIGYGWPVDDELIDYAFKVIPEDAPRKK